MIAKVEFGCLATGIGSMPHPDPETAHALITKYLPIIPHWAQLPKRSQKENMYLQFSEGFPGITLEENKIYIDRSQNFDQVLEQFYLDYIDNNADKYAISAEYAAGLYALLAGKPSMAKMVKGQITGPISWGLSVTDRQHRGILYDNILSDVIAKFLKLKAMWQEKVLKEICAETIIFVDEPYLASLGSAFVSVPNEQVITSLKEVFSGISGLKGVHCCGGADWSFILSLPLDILSFDAYNYGDSLTLYTTEVKSFLKQGGTIAWGIVPNDEEILAKESVASLQDRLGEIIAPLTRNGIPFKQIVRQGLLTPSCGLGLLSPEASLQALELLAELSERIRKKYVT